ncbi:hypothetical protein [Rhizobium leguminosarum]|uniref:hypothetical protein n=1 Tax=Rhizobium leguminosarum TaxID=384 RepID=UPI00103E65F8|nr:hypothetical protein [Rhizobium leguminosarum]MBY5461844.1 hypothetical protein [Rhizobium leguminosarum]TCA42869.1 hypothetical protein E0H72_15675 [Rhizobium leguminosarum bv. viciae]
MRIIDYDQQEDWLSWFSDVLSDVVAQDALRKLRSSNFEYLHDAGGLVLDIVGEDRLAKVLSDRLEPYSFRVYHGTRLTDEEVLDVRTIGLVPLDLNARKARYPLVFGKHERWAEVVGSLESVVERLRNENLGNREDGRVWACMSRAEQSGPYGMHYVRTGAEVDHHVGHALFGDETGDEHLMRYGKPYLVPFVVPYAEAVCAVDHFRLPDDIRLPSLTRRLLDAWAFSHVDRNYRFAADNGSPQMGFLGSIQPSRIETFIEVQ